MRELRPNEKIYELECKFDSRKSFYKKAFVYVNCTKENNEWLLTNDGTTTLYSYDTRVCEITHGKPNLYYTFNYSATTLRHVKEFLKQNGFVANNVKQMMKDYGNFGI